MSKHKILFLHGWLFDRRIWFGLDRIISGGNQSVMVDLPGYGKNKENNSTLVSYCREIFSSQLSPTVIIGWSFGGTLALLGLSRYCPNIEKIVIINSHPLLIGNNGLDDGINSKNIESIKHNLVSNREETLKKFFFECVKGSPHEMNDYKLLIKSFELSTLPNNHTLIRGLDNLSNINNHKALRDTQKEVLFISSEKDSLLGERSYSEFKNKKNIKFSFLKNAPHMPFISFKKEIIDVVNKFL